MTDILNMSSEELSEEKKELKRLYQAIQREKWHLDMSRGILCEKQLDISLDMLKNLADRNNFFSESGQDCRNYGSPSGILEVKKIFAELLQANEEQVFVYGDSSLKLMFDLISKSVTHGVCGFKPWNEYESVKFLCPVPGYERHFSITEYFHVAMINIPMNNEGPDMDMIERLVREDESIKGIWCVPMYSNPSGITYSDETVRRLARLPAKAPDFRIYWDEAYCVHHLYKDRRDTLMDIMKECDFAGFEDRVYKFLSTSKICFPGFGISVVVSSGRNQKDIRSHLFLGGNSKLNQLCFADYFKTGDRVREHMKKHARILQKKFDMVSGLLKREFGAGGLAEWSDPKGGYFISFYCMEGCAKKIAALMEAAGVFMTRAGSTYPYFENPKDDSIRIAPSALEEEQIEKAIGLFVICVKLVSIEKLQESEPKAGGKKGKGYEQQEAM